MDWSEEWLDIDYATSFELSFRLLLTRTPRRIAALREEWDISQKNVVFNDKRFGCMDNLKGNLTGVPNTFQYHLSHRIRRVVANENTSRSYQQVAREVKIPRERVKCTLEVGRTGWHVLIQQSASGGEYTEAEKDLNADGDNIRESEQ